MLRFTRFHIVFLTLTNPFLPGITFAMLSNDRGKMINDRDRPEGNYHFSTLNYHFSTII